MSVAFILNPTYSYVENNRLNQALEVTESVSAPIHYVDDLSISKNEAGHMVFTSPVVEATVVSSLSSIASAGVFTSALNPLEGETVVNVNGDLDFSSVNSISNVVKLTVASGAPTAGYVLSSSDTAGTLAWVPRDAGGVPTLSEVLTSGNAAGDQDITGVKDLGVTSLTVASGAPTAGYVLSSSDNAGTLAWIPDATGSTPSLSQVLAVSGDGGNQPITNVENLYVNGVINSADSLETPVLSVKTQDGLGYYVMTSNASGVDLNTKFTSDGLILHKVAAGSDITIQNDANNLVTLGTATGLADIKVNSIDVGGAVLTSTGDPAYFETTAGIYTTNEIGTTTDLYCQNNFALYNSVFDPVFQGRVGNNDVLSFTNAKIHGFGDIEGATLTSTSTTGTVIKNADSSFTVGASGTINAESITLTNGTDKVLIGTKGFSNIDDTKITCNTNFEAPNVIATSSMYATDSINVVNVDNSGTVSCNWLTVKNNDITLVDLQTSGDLRSYNASSILDFGTIATTSNGTVSTGQLLPGYKPLRTLWVSSNNAYATPNGSYENPYTTIQAAITYAESVYDNTYWYINVLPGTYSGFIATKKVFVKGMAPSSPDGCSVGCQITSDITVAFDSNDGDMFNNQFSLSGFLVAGAKVVDSSTARHVINITDCYLYNDSGTGRLIDCRPSSSDCRLIILNSKLTNVSPSAGDPLVEMSVGMARFAQSQFQCSGVQNVIKFSGTSRVDSIVLCSFTSTNASAVIPAIVEITSSTSSAFTFANCSFVYSSATDKSASLSSCAIYANAAATSTVITILYNTFALTGTSNSSNFVVNHGAVPCVTLFFSNGATLNTTHTINGNNNTTKFSLQAVA